MALAMYTPLDRAARQIRLAHLAPSPTLEEVPSCSLHVVSLDDNPYFEALSYVWGDPTITTPIQLRAPPQRNSDGVQAAPVLSDPAEGEVYSSQWPVATNLEAALRYLRHQSEIRILWIDAICIDQSNIEERNHQVPLMRTIYSNAVVVRVWLGSPFPGSDDALAMLLQMGQSVPLEKIKIRDRVIQENDLQSMIKLSTRPWWSRTWVQQELVLAKRAILHCGFTCIEWNDMPSFIEIKRSLVLGLKSAGFGGKVWFDFMDSFKSLNRVHTMAKIAHLDSELTSTDLGPVFILALGRQCGNSVDHDSIYGFLGLMSESFASKIKPDYNISISEVFQNAAIQLTAYSDSLILLSLTKYMTRQARWFPTWVPSWKTLGRLEFEEWNMRVGRLSWYEELSACAGNTMKFEAVSGQVLKLSGVQLDQVLRNGIAGPFEVTFGVDEILGIHREWILLSGLDVPGRSTYVAGGKATDAFWRTLSSDFYPKKSYATVRRCRTKDYKAYRRWVDELEDPRTEYWKSDVALNYNFVFRESCSGRRFFVAKKGYFGVGSTELEEGDQIYIIAGGKVPLVLRPLPESQPNTFELVGDCYVHGVMDGEAVTERAQDSGRNPWKKAVAAAKSFIRSSSESRDPDLPLRDFHDVFIV